MNIKDKLLSKKQMEQLIGNGKKDYMEIQPVVRIFSPNTYAIWYLMSVNQEENDIAFCIADLGLGHVEFGTVRLSELKEINVAGCFLENDKLFYEATKYPAYAYYLAGRKAKSLYNLKNSEVVKYLKG